MFEVISSSSVRGRTRQGLETLHTQLLYVQGVTRGPQEKLLEGSFYSSVLYL